MIKIGREPVSEVATRRLENRQRGRGKLKCEEGGGQVRDVEGQNRVTEGMGSRGIERAGRWGKYSSLKNKEILIFLVELTKYVPRRAEKYQGSLVVLPFRTLVLSEIPPPPLAN